MPFLYDIFQAMQLNFNSRTITAINLAYHLTGFARPHHNTSQFMAIAEHVSIVLKYN